MKTAIEQFRQNILRVRELSAMRVGLASSISSDLSDDLLRIEIVSAVSALDRFIHDLVRIGMLKILISQRSTTPVYLRFQVSMETLLYSEMSNSEEERLTLLDNEIQTRHGWLSFQHPEKIAEAIRLISEVKLWEEVAKELGKDAKGVKKQLEAIVKKRDQIAHEADNITTSYLPKYPNLQLAKKWPITSILANESVDFIERLAEAIYKVVV
jgi:hypothetical protein